VIKIVFVCYGNICRSPMAEGMFQKIIESQNLSKEILVQSRGTSSYEVGQPPHPKTQQILNRLNIAFHHMTSKKIETADYSDFDYIVGMDHENVDYLKRHAGQQSHKVFLLRDIDPQTKGEIILDPYYTGRYEETYELLKESLGLWVEKLRSEIKK